MLIIFKANPGNEAIVLGFRVLKAIRNTSKSVRQASKWRLKCKDCYPEIRKMPRSRRGKSVEMTSAFIGLEGFCTIFVSFTEIGAESRTFVVSAWYGDSVCVSSFQYLAMILNQKSCCFRKI